VAVVVVVDVVLVVDVSVVVEVVGVGTGVLELAGAAPP
jgi:hypothetical protein